MNQRIIKHQTAILWIVLIAASFFALKTSDEPLLGVFRNTWVESLLQQCSTGNSIIFSLSIGFIVSFIFYFVIVLLPERSKALQIARDSGQFRDWPSQNGTKRWYYIEVKNLHRQEIAHNCLVYLQNLQELSTAEKKVLPLVEFKWEGLLTQSVSIPPKKSRLFDGFYVYHGSPNIVHLGINKSLIDDYVFYTDYTVKGPGDFTLTYIIYSVNFSPVKATLKLHIGNTLGDIRFELP